METLPATSSLVADERDVLDAVMDAGTLVDKCRSLTQLLFLAGEGLIRSDKKTANAITTGCDMADDMLSEVSNLIEEISEKLKAEKNARASA
jgi:hypothetical protein